MFELMQIIKFLLIKNSLWITIFVRELIFA